jgi:Ca-activated chloride channel homolog
MNVRVQILCLIMMTTSLVIVYGQSVRSLVNDGNNLYKEQKFNDAEVNYRKALEKEPELVQGHFNLGNVLYKQNKPDESIREYENALLKAEAPETKAYAYYNIGNAHMKAQNYQEAVQSYIESLKLNPTDQETKYNLSYALEKLKEQQQKQQNKNDRNKDKNNKGQNKNDQKNNDQQKQDQKKRDNDQQKQDQQQQQRQQQSQQEKRMSKADAERILEVLKNNEKDVQKKLRVRQGARAKVDKDW